MIQPITQSENQFDSYAARYFIAQHMPDVMRKETRNIGIIVQKGDDRVSRFLGQSNVNGNVDARSLKSFPDVRLYKMWLRHWQKSLKNDDWEAKIIENSKVSFQFIPGGEVTDTGSDSADEIANYLFSLLVSSGGLSEALGAAEEPNEVSEITRSIKSEFRRLKIMKSVANREVRNPIFEDQHLEGSKNWHDVTFFQEDQKSRWVFEPLDLNERIQKKAKERAGYLAYMLGDLRKKSSQKDVNTQVILRVSDDARDMEHVEYAISVVSNNADIIDWNDTKERKQLLNQCESIAYAA